MKIFDIPYYYVKNYYLNNNVCKLFNITIQLILLGIEGFT